MKLGYFLLIMLLLALPVLAQRNTPESWATEQRQLAANGDGYLVWESNRTGNWRIWTINLDGSDERMLAPEEKGRDHTCPHISPDGLRLVYLSLPSGEDGYNKFPRKSPCPLYIINRDGSGNRKLVDDARAYFEDRAAVWVDAQRLIYVGGDGQTYQINVDTGVRDRLTTKPETEYGFLINATKTYATTGFPSFSPYQEKTKSIDVQRNQSGCQPYFSNDGKWGFWMGGAGGPINRFNLATRAVSPILARDDARMPRERHYLYFPMLSRSGLAFAFAASPEQHDHFTADYDIFAALINPDTLEIIGNPVRYTFHPGCDRFPDIYLVPRELGQQTDEAPYTARFTHKELATGGWKWEYGDGTTGEESTHNYPEAGSYTVEARKGDQRLRGVVMVSKASAPTVVSAMLVEKRKLVVTFNEPVQLKNPQFSLTSQTLIEQSTLQEDGYRLTLQLAAEPKPDDELTLSGVTDRAQRPNALAVTKVKLQRVAWPVSRDGLAFCWATAKTPNPLRITHAVKPHGTALYTHDYAMLLKNGSFTVEGIDAPLLQACKASNALTIEAVIQPANLQQKGPARIISFSTNNKQRNFTLGQEDNNIVLRLRTPQTGTNGTNPTVTLCQIDTKEPTHITVTYAANKLICYVNGKATLTTDQVKGDFSNWDVQHIVFGNEWSADDRHWAGTIEGVALYSRVLSASEVQAEYTSYKAIIDARIPVPRVTVQAKLLARSTMPTLKEITPYSEALVVYTYQVERVYAGECTAKIIRVAHWAILDKQVQPGLGLKEDTSVELALEPFALNPQLESTYLKDDIEGADDAPVYYDIR